MVLESPTKYYIPYFKDAYRPLCVRDYFTIRCSNGQKLWFKVQSIEPNDMGIVAPNTMLYSDGDPVQE